MSVQSEIKSWFSLTMVVASLALVIGSTGCSVVRAGGESVEAVGEGAGHAISGVGEGADDVLSGTGRAIKRATE